MIVPSIDLVNGRAVQMVGGEDIEIDAGDPHPILERFSLVGEVAVIDIDAARGEGTNAELIQEMCRLADIRVGGGIRDVETAIQWLDAGASKIIIGTAASPDLLRQLPAERVIVALDSRHGEVVANGWRRGTNQTVKQRMAELEGLCTGFLVTFVEVEGRMAGTELQRAEALVSAAGNARLTIAGGVTTADEVAHLDRLGADAQVGMALYSGRLDLAEALAAPLTSDRNDGLWPTTVVNESGVALGLAWSSQESLSLAIDSERGVYQSRSRGIWEKGATSGAYQELIRIDLDCDRDALRFTVRQKDPGFCHNETATCWDDGSGLTALARKISTIAAGKPGGGSNTLRLLNDPDLLASKLKEEAIELGDASTHEDVITEAADVIYFALTKAAGSGVSLAEIETELDRRSRRVTRRPMEAKR